MLTCVDLFAGMGGTAEGAAQAGLEVLVSANHWPVAVETHRKNHPEVEHYLQDLQQANFYAWPDFDVLLASPACQGHSAARGTDRPHHDAARSTAWAVVAAAEAKRPKFLAVENVPEFKRWGLYPQWRSCLETLGYVLSETVLNAADLGVPQSRRRLFVVGVHREVSAVPVRVGPGDRPHVGASTVLDDEGREWSAVTRQGRAGATLARIENGRREHGDRFLLAYFGKEKGGRSVDRPLGTVLTRDRYALVDGDRMRMLTAREYLKAQGFRGDYVLPASHKEAVHLIGNSVPPPVARHVCEAIKNHQRG